MFRCYSHTIISLLPNSATYKCLKNKIQPSLSWFSVGSFPLLLLLLLLILEHFLLQFFFWLSTFMSWSSWSSFSIKVSSLHQLMHQWVVLKTILKFTLKQLRHVSVLQLHHHQSTAEQCNIQTPIRTQYMQPHHHRINHTPMYFNGLF